MRWTDYYAIAATVVTVAVVGYGSYLLTLPAPQRGPGAAAAMVFVVGAMLAALVHGSVATGLALWKHPGTVAWVALAVHGLVLLAGVIAALRR